MEGSSFELSNLLRSKIVADGIELSRELPAQRSENGDGGDSDESGNQAIFDRSCAALIREKRGLAISFVCSSPLGF